MTTIQELKWSSMSPAIDRIQSPNNFLTRFLFTTERTLDTETVELSFWKRGRKIAPFVKKNGEAVMIDGPDREFATVETPNIRIKRPIHPSDLLANRQPGSVIFPSSDQIARARREYIARELQPLKDDLVESTEYLVAQALTGTISYSVSPEEVFTITYPKTAAHTYTAATKWDDATPPDPSKDIMKVKRLMAKQSSMVPTDAICGEKAAEAFLLNSEVRKMLDQKNVTAGQMTLNEQFNDAGAMFLGTYEGIRFWEYSRETDVNGTLTKLVADKDIHFVHRGPAAQNWLYYGAIPDMRSLNGRLFKGRVFSKSWRQEDPSVLYALAHSRPLPVPRKIYGSVVTVTVAT